MDGNRREGCPQEKPHPDRPKQKKWKYPFYKKIRIRHTNPSRNIKSNSFTIKFFIYMGSHVLKCFTCLALLHSVEYNLTLAPFSPQAVALSIFFPS